MENRFYNNKRFMRFFIGSSISKLGDSMDNMAFMLLAIALTGSPKSTGIMLMIVSIPGVIFSVFGGTFADMFNRKKIMVRGSIVRGSLIALLLILYSLKQVNFMWLCGILFMLETVSVFVRPASGATVPNLLPRSEFKRATPTFSNIGTIINLVGPAISSFMIAVTGFYFPLTFDSVSYFFSAFMINGVDIEKTEEAKKNSKEKPKFKDIMKSSKEGFEYLWERKFLLRLVGVIMCLNIMLALFDVPMPFLIKENYGLNELYYGYLKMFITGATFIGGFYLSKRDVKKPGRFIIRCVFLMGIATTLFGMSKTFIVGALLSCISSFARVCIGITYGIFITLATEDEYRGRVFGSTGILIALVVPLSMGISGYIVEWFSAKSIFIGGGVFFIILALIFSLDKVLMNYEIEEDEGQAIGA